MIKSIATLLFSLALPSLAHTQTVVDGANIYKRCAACHQASGAGVPGVYPKLGAQVARFAANPQGRAYLITVVSAGIMGELKIDGRAYNGYMPAQAGLGDEQVAALLNHVVGGVAKASSAKLFTTDEVKAVRAEHASAKPTETMKLRPKQ